MAKLAVDSRSSSEGLARDADAELASAQPDASERAQVQVRNQQQVNGILASSTADGHAAVGHAAVDPGLFKAKNELIWTTSMGLVPTAESWKLLATHACGLAEDGQDAARLAQCLRRAKVSWENVTEDQRAVFMSLNGREQLRRELLTNSRLFDAITSMQVKPSDKSYFAHAVLFGNAEEKQRRDDFELGRSQGDAPPHPEADSVAALLRGWTLADALTEPVTRRDPVVNRELEGWVRRHSDAISAKRPTDSAGADRDQNEFTEKIVKWGCGIGNLFALAFSRGQVPGCPDPSTPPTLEAAKAWLKSWTLDRKGGLLDATAANAVGLTYNAGVVVADAATSTVTQGRFHQKLSWKQSPKDSPEQRSAALTRMVSTQLPGLALGAEQESRLALTQGMKDLQTAHTYFLYKDLDSVWRPMDVYLEYEDHAGESDGTNSDRYPAITQLYFVVDGRASSAAR